MECQSHRFNIPADITYLNCSYMGPLTHEVMKAGREAIYRKGTPYDITVKDFFEPVNDLKAAFAQLINASEPQRIAVVPSVSYGFAAVAKNIPVSPGENIVTIEEQFPSNMYCWQRLCAEGDLELRCVAAPQEQAKRGKVWNEKILESIDEKTAAVSIGTVHWADGTRFDLEAIRARTREVGAMLVVDGTQSIGALPFDLNKFNPDAVICAGYKWLLGPYALSVAYFGPAFDNGVPIEENWINRMGSDDFQGQVGYTEEYQPFSVRYDMGEKSNFFLVPMLVESLNQIMSWGVQEIQSYCESITTATLAKLVGEGFLIEDPAYRTHNIFGIRFPKGFEVNVVKEALAESKVHVSFRGDAIRVSPHLYNSEQHLQKLYECLILGVN